mmetsp:Transcript_47611/g.132771  ORF Transcript_47611/g.132771 Transcript_47611/m.132771 type:complete len:204 (-) Transcript_47611:472-1083(-)
MPRRRICERTRRCRWPSTSRCNSIGGIRLSHSRSSSCILYTGSTRLAPLAGRQRSRRRRDIPACRRRSRLSGRSRELRSTRRGRSKTRIRQRHAGTTRCWPRALGPWTRSQRAPPASLSCHGTNSSNPWLGRRHRRRRSRRAFPLLRRTLRPCLRPRWSLAAETTSRQPPQAPPIAARQRTARNARRPQALPPPIQALCHGRK